MTPAACDVVLGVLRSWREALPAQRRMFASELSTVRLEPQQLAGAWHWFLIGWKNSSLSHTSETFIKR